MSPLPVDNSGALPSHLVTQDIIEIKTLLVKVKGLLEKVSHKRLITQIKPY